MKIPRTQLRLVLCLVALFVLPAVARAQINTTYSFNLNPGTSAGNPVTNMMIFEASAGGSQLFIDYGGTPNGFTINGTGFSTLTHTSAFNPAMSLIVGLTQQVSKTSLVIFMNDAFAASATGVLFNNTFSSIGHNALIARLRVAETGSQSDLDWFRDVFFPIDGSRAAFVTGGSHTAMEFTAGFPIGTVPEHSDTALLLSVSCGLMLAMCRWKSLLRDS